MSAPTEDARELVENLCTHLPLGRTDERVIERRYTLWMGPGKNRFFNMVERLRLTPDEVEPTVAEIRELLAARGREAATWLVGASARPANLVEELISLGLTPDPEEPVACGMVLTGELSGSRSGIEVQRVTGLDQFATVRSIFSEVFGATPELSLAEEMAAAPEGEVCYLALFDGEPVAVGKAIFTPRGAALMGGATRPEARGRGAYRALVWARYEEARRRGVPLVTQEGKMSRPILERFGFRSVVELRILLDYLGAEPGPSSPSPT